MSTKVKIIMPTDEEDAAITAAALSDPDAQPLTDEELAQFRRGRGRPAQAVTKIPTTLRIDPEVLQAFKATGVGWQTRMNQVLYEWADAHGLLKSR
ncbi:BrnA antitoxin family protein [Pseudoduganella sp. LjRoot289]|uniref:BrnA antitoxin family protein n=1 Tax=Pseudoduganella sp. LjRoot289 TaxID=3342314 RepID=UPI003ECE6026